MRVASHRTLVVGAGFFLIAHEQPVSDCPNYGFKEECDACRDALDPISVIAEGQMNCFTHDRLVAVGFCVVCQKAVCKECVGRDAPRLVCKRCAEGGAVFGFEYRSSVTIGAWPLIHICTGVDQATMRPRVAKGVIAIGNIAVGGLAVGGVACGLIAFGGVALGILSAIGGAALGLGVSFGGLAVGSIAFGGAAVGFTYAIGGGAFGPAVIDGRQCADAAREFLERWLGTSALPPSCR